MMSTWNGGFGGFTRVKDRRPEETDLVASVMFGGSSSPNSLERNSEKREEFKV